MTYERVPITGTASPGYMERLAKIWETEPGLLGWFSTVDHKEIGLRYIVTAFVFLVAGGVEALIMRLQLARPNEHLLTPEQYDQLFTMHGMTMIFLYAVPVLSGFSQLSLAAAAGRARHGVAAAERAVLLDLSSRRAFSSMPASRWVRARTTAGSIMSLCARKAYNPGPNIDFYALGMILLGISTTVGAINFVVTFLRLRAPGMSINRVPILIWGTLTASVANIFAVPAVSLAFFLLWMDRNFGTHFFDVSSGGQPLLWQHLFWMFGHPWVYAIVLPAMGMVSDGLPVFCRRPLVGYTAGGAGDRGDHGARASASGCTTCSRPACRASRCPSSAAPRSSSRCPARSRVFAWTRDDLDRAAGLHHRVPVLRQLDRAVRHRRRLRLHDRLGAGRLATDRHLFRRRAYPLRADRHQRVPGGRRASISGFPRSPDGCSTRGWAAGISGRCSSASISPSFPCIFRPAGACRAASTPIPTHMGWDTLNLITSVGSFMFAVGVLLTLRQCRYELASGPPGRRQSVGRADAGMGDALAAAALQFRRHPDRRKPPSAVGGAARRKSRRAPLSTTVCFWRTAARRSAPRRSTASRT